VRFAPVAVFDGTGTVAASGGYVTPSFFDVLGGVPARGRTFTPAEAVPGGPALVVLSWNYWQRALGGDESAVGSVLTLDARPHEVIGVMPAGFEFLNPDTDFWLPIQEIAHAAPRGERDVFPLARMAPGVGMATVKRDIAQISAEIEAAHPQTHRGWTMDAINLRDDFPDPQSRTIYWLLQGAVLIVLLIACANIANLLLARAVARQGEIALRLALGSGRLRIVRQLTRESLALAVLGGAAGLVLAYFGIDIMARQMGPYVPRMWHPQLDGGVVAFSAVLTIMCGLIFGLVPALQALRRDQMHVLRQGAAAVAGGRGRRRLSAALVTAEIALCLAAIGSGFVLLRGINAALDPWPGYDNRNVLTVRFSLPAHGYGSIEELLDVQERMRDEVAAIPGVASAALVNTLPQNLLAPSDTFLIDGRPLAPGEAAPRAISLRASPEYPRTLDVPVVAGRFFDERDRIGTAPVAVISRALAEARFDGTSPIGERLTVLGVSREIVGVAPDVQQILFETQSGGSRETIYLPLAQMPGQSAFLMIRTARDPHAFADAVRAAIWRVDQDIIVMRVRTMQEFVDQWAFGVPVITGLLRVFGVLALLLASLGTYGVVAYSIGQRAQEIGVRIALGAGPRDVVRMIAQDGMRMALLGIAAGLVLLVPMLRAVQTGLAGIVPAPVELRIVAGAALVLFAVTMLASILPARAAARVDPVTVLRAE
jgi:putative ABC transport system permease protein